MRTTHDLDGDGNLDLVVVETGDSYQVNVYYGPLSGSYPSSAADARLLLQTEEYVDLVVGDLDRDGFHDIGIGYETRDAMDIFIGGSL